MTKDQIAQLAQSKNPAAQYAAKYAQEDYLWDELAALAWLDPAIISRSTTLYMDVSTDPGATYGDTLTWATGQKPPTPEPLVEVQEDLDPAKFYREFIGLMTRSAPHCNAN
jgi:inosine-uridine nucleoside N-ribohydrolase